MKKITLFIIGLFLLIFHTNSLAQTAEASSTIEKNILQIELESVYTIQKEGHEKMKSWSIPSALFRFGLTDGLEFQLNTPIIKEKLWQHDHLIHSLNKFDDIQLGVAINLWKQQNLIPEASLMIRAILPTNTNFKIDKIGNLVSLNLSNVLSKKLLLTYNIGYVAETDNSKSAFYIANLAFEASAKYHFHVETFGDFANSEFTSLNIGTGLGYNFNNQLTFDLSMANGINHSLFYVGGILTFVFDTKKSNI